MRYIMSWYENELKWDLRHFEVRSTRNDSEQNLLQLRRRALWMKHGSDTIITRNKGDTLKILSTIATGTAKNQLRPTWMLHLIENSGMLKNEAYHYQIFWNIVYLKLMCKSKDIRTKRRNCCGILLWWKIHYRPSMKKIRKFFFFEQWKFYCWKRDFCTEISFLINLTNENNHFSVWSDFQEPQIVGIIGPTKNIFEIEDKAIDNIFLVGVSLPFFSNWWKLIETK